MSLIGLLFAGAVAGGCVGFFIAAIFTGRGRRR